jgi:hypothetical protein
MSMFAVAVQRVRAVSGLTMAAGLILFAPSAGAIEESFPVLETQSGTYSNVTVTTKSKTYIFIHHATGMTSVKVGALPLEVQQQLGYAEAANNGGRLNVVLARQLTPEVKAKIKPIEDTWRAGMTQGREQFSANPALAYGLLAGVLLFYLFFCYCCHLICMKAKKPGGFLVWLPILQMIPLFRAAGMSGWWFLAGPIPVLNIIAHVLWALNIAKARGKGVLVGVMMILPVTSLLAFLYLAFSSEAPEEVKARYRSMSLQTA